MTSVIDVNNCIIINLDYRKELWDNFTDFREKWKSLNKRLFRMPAVNHKNETNVILKYIANNRISINGSGFRKNKESLLGEIGCFMSHYNCWKHIVENKLDACMILEEGIEFLREDFNNLTINVEKDITFINTEMNQYDFTGNLTGYGTQGYVVSYKGAELLMQKCYTMYIPIDLQIRHLCNTKEINAICMNASYVKRNHTIISSIDTFKTSQSTDTILHRILMNLSLSNINIDNFL
jgi:GR25 family glycosyltransferase involved in LPS biosynthesis